MLYKYAVPKPKSECSKTEQLGVSFAAGYIAGIFCAVVSHPADNLVSKMNASKGLPASERRSELRAQQAVCVSHSLGGRW
jgi:solute carrier family 25 phosphate transporter 3